jgi:hypothetical protein
MNIYDIDREIHRCIRGKGLTREQDRPATHVRREKMRVLREEIQRGAYRINYDKIAENMFFLFTNDIPCSMTYH